jgi:hypothetical protein
MAGWTSPRTWVASEVPTAAIFNAHVRDNLNALNGFVYKTADQSVTSSAVLVNDTHLTYAIPAVGKYVIDVFLYATSAANAAGDLGVGFTFPTGTFYLGGEGPDIGLASSTVQTGQWGSNVAYASGAIFNVYGLSTSVNYIHLHGLFVATATGTLQFQWAQQASNASASTVKAGSHMLVQQVA